MLRRRIATALVGLVLLGSSGCCHRGPWPCGNTYCGSQCGFFYWHEWFSHKPRCCDPCNFCGDFVCSRNPYVKTGPPYTRFGELYSDGSGSNQPGAIGEMYSTPQSPTPAEAAEGLMDNEGPVEATPNETMPDDLFPGESPPVDRFRSEELPGPSTQLPRGGYGRTASRYGTVDSPPPSRTLGGPSRKRIFTR